MLVNYNLMVNHYYNLLLVYFYCSQPGSHDHNIEDIVATCTVHSNKYPPSTGAFQHRYEVVIPFLFEMLLLLYANNVLLEVCY